MSDDKYYSKEKFVCHECGREHDTPGAAESCWKDEMIESQLRIAERREEAFDGDVNQLKPYIQKLEDAIEEYWEEGDAEPIIEACEWRTKERDWRWPH